MNKLYKCFYQKELIYDGGTEVKFYSNLTMLRHGLLIVLYGALNVNFQSI